MQERADLLEEVDTRARQLVKELVASHSNKCYTSILSTRYGKVQLYEADPDSELTAYTTEKRSIALCLRRIKGDVTSPLVDSNTLMYVLVHEMAHLGIDHQGHVPEFWDAFKEIARVAVAIGVLQYVDYSKKNEQYCAMPITGNIQDATGNGTSFTIP
jgi:predicted metal-dependent hydrolase